MHLQDLKVNMPYLELEAEFHDKTDIIPLKNPFLISYSLDAAEILGVEIDDEGFLTKLTNGEVHLQGSHLL